MASPDTLDPRLERSIRLLRTSCSYSRVTVRRTETKIQYQSHKGNIIMQNQIIKSWPYLEKTGRHLFFTITSFNKSIHFSKCHLSIGTLFHEAHLRQFIKNWRPSIKQQGCSNPCWWNLTWLSCWVYRLYCASLSAMRWGKYGQYPNK